MGGRRVLVAAVASGLALAVSASASAVVVISRISFDAPGDDSRAGANLNAEWVELRNTGSAPVVLTGWTVRDKERHVYRFEAFTLAPNRTVRVHTGSGRDGARHVYQDLDGWVWNNDGDTATLRNRAGKKVDSCSYSGSGNSVSC